MMFYVETITLLSSVSILWKVSYVSNGEKTEVSLTRTKLALCDCLPKQVCERLLSDEIKKGEKMSQVDFMFVLFSILCWSLFSFSEL